MAVFVRLCAPITFVITVIVASPYFIKDYVHTPVLRVAVVFLDLFLEVRRFICYLLPLLPHTVVGNVERILTRALRATGATVQPFNAIAGSGAPVLVRLVHVDDPRKVGARNVILYRFRTGAD